MDQPYGDDPEEIGFDGQKVHVTLPLHNVLTVFAIHFKVVTTKFGNRPNPPTKGGIMTTSTTKFGKLLQAFRKREGLSQLKLAALLGIDDSTVNRIEAGTRKPPRDPRFYQKLREVPGFTDNDIARLMSTEDAPPWLAEIRH